MRIPLLFSGLLALTLAASISSFASEPGKLDGSWIEIVPEPPRVGYSLKPDPIKLVVEKNSMIDLVGNSAIRQSLLTFPANQAKEAIDIVTVVDGEFWNIKGIYKLEGDVLTISEAARDAARPKDFRPWESTLDQLVLVRSFKRMKYSGTAVPLSSIQCAGTEPR